MNNKTWQRLMFRSAFFFTLVVTPTAAICGVTQITVTTFAAIGVVAMILTRLQDIVSIKVFGLEAQLQSKIDEANATIEQLQELAVAVAQPVITNLGIQGHFVQLKYVDRYNMRETVNGLLSNIGIQRDSISSINSAFDQMFRKLLVARMLGTITTEEKFSGRAEEMRTRNDVPMSSEIGAFLRELNLLTDERNKYLEELSFFEDTGTLRTPTILDK